MRRPARHPPAARTTRPDGVLGHLLRVGGAAGLAVRDAPGLQTAFLARCRPVAPPGTPTAR
ncbi:hypothetical protein [Streptomyces sp. NPDC008122]|uniref:hypothetical protein n=1 Tax=Streptomyces sp. NPDC008122 TaxID=3364810 RepID=UPI0036DFB657